MNKLLRKSAPLGVMTALTIWCCWTQVRDAKPLIAATDDAKLPRIERDSLRPVISPASQRDPFLQIKPEPVAAPVAAAVAAAVPEEPPVDPQAVLRSITLNATMMGARPLSVVNGRMFGEGQLISLESFPNARIEVREIRANGITLQIETHDFEIQHGHTATPERAKTAPATGRHLPSLAELNEMITGSPGQNHPRLDNQDDSAVSGGDERTPVADP